MSFINFCLDHWEIIFSCLMILLSVLMALFKKKPVSDILSWIYKFSCMAVNTAEITNLKGFDKLHAALSGVKAALKSKFPGLNVDIYDDLIIEIIENILSTPQKK